VGSIYKTEKVRQQVIEMTKKFRGQISGEIRDHYLDTSFGKTYVLETGEPSLPTIVVLHGGMTNHAFILYFLRELIGKYRIICPDIPGHAGYSTEDRIDPGTDDFGYWLVEILDQLEVFSADFVGTSYGGFVTNRVIAVAPQRVRSATLIVPGGIVGMSTLNLVRHVIVWQTLYAALGFETFFQRIMNAFFTDCPDVDVKEFFRMTLTGMKVDTRQMKLSSVEECNSFDRPVYVIASEHDVVFNCNALRARVKHLYPHAIFEVLKGSRHSPSIKPENLANLNAKVIKFLDASKGNS
jgi:pimeloyl-ACP methyl ester carboxylesterase